VAACQGDRHRYPQRRSCLCQSRGLTNPLGHCRSSRAGREPRVRAGAACALPVDSRAFLTQNILRRRRLFHREQRAVTAKDRDIRWRSRERPGAAPRDRFPPEPLADGRRAEQRSSRFRSPCRSSVAGNRRAEEHAVEPPPPHRRAGLGIRARHHADLVGHVNQAIVNNDGRDVGGAARRPPQDMAPAHIAFPAGPEGQVIAVAIAAAQVDDAVREDGARNRRLALAAAYQSSLPVAGS